MIIDTNILVGFGIRDLIKIDLQEENKIQKFKKLTRRIVPVFVVTEFDLVMTRVIPRRYTKSIDLFKVASSILINKLESFVEIYYPNENDYKLALNIFNNLKQKSKLSFLDIFIMAIAKNNNTEILTLDKELNRFFEKLG